MRSRRLRVGSLTFVLLAMWTSGAARGQGLSGDSLVQRLKAAELSRLMNGGRAGSAASRIDPGALPAAPGRARPFRPITTGDPNVLVNDRSLDAPGSVQSGASIAACGNLVVAAWNDGPRASVSTVGYAYSVDDGATWIDGGSPPVTGGVGQWTGGPVVAANEKAGTFYLAAACQPTNGTNGVAVVKGTFVDGVLQWGTPSVAITGNSQVALYDQPWLAADSSSGNLYLVYARRFLLNGTNRIDYQRNTGDNATAWSAPSTLSSPDDVARVGQPRVAMGPSGVVWAAWHTIGRGALDFVKVRRSTNFGAFFTQEVTVASLYPNFGSGAPGFSLGAGQTYPSLAADRTFGPHRGRVYMTWNESLDYFDDPLDTAGAAIEYEPNESPGTATPFAIGQILSGAISVPLDVDDWSFHGEQGRTVICFLDAGSSPTVDIAFRMLCSDGTTRLAFSRTGSGGVGLIVFTPPATGTYTLSVQPFSGTGAYTIHTGANGKPAERARDQRDVMVAYSDDGLSWSTPTRVNDDPGYYDDWLPEIAVADFGRPYVMWYDWRDAPAATCGGVSHVYLARSDDGGDTWTSQGPVTDTQTAWTSVVSNTLPNQGLHLGAFGNPRGLYLAWADGRLGDPDVFSTTLLGHAVAGVPAAPPVELAIEGVRPNPAVGEMWVTFSLARSEAATLELIDVAGRRVHALAVSGAGRQTLDLAAGVRLSSGVYVIRLTQAGHSTLTRVSVVR